MSSARDRVKITGWLIAGLAGLIRQGARHGLPVDAAHLEAGSAGVSFDPPVRLIKQLLCALTASAAAHVGHHRHLDIFQRVQGGQQVVKLEYKAYSTATELVEVVYS